MFLAPLLNLQGSFLGLGVNGQGDAAIDDAVKYPIRISGQINTLAFGKPLKTLSQDVVFGHYLDDIETCAKTLAPNSARIVPFGSSPVLLVRTATGELRAFSGTCTHLDCTVQYRPDLGHIWCACHNGHYDLNGRNIAGPPPQPLAPFDVALRDDEIMISRKA